MNKDKKPKQGKLKFDKTITIVHDAEFDRLTNLVNDAKKEYETGKN